MVVASCDRDGKTKCVSLTFSGANERHNRLGRKHAEDCFENKYHPQLQPTSQRPRFRCDLLGSLLSVQFCNSPHCCDVAERQRPFVPLVKLSLNLIEIDD